MTDIDWDKLAKDTREKTNKQLREEISTHVRLNDDDLKKILREAKVDEKTFLEVLKVVKDTTRTNNQKAKAINNIDKGLRTILAVVERVL